MNCKCVSKTRQKLKCTIIIITIVMLKLNQTLKFYRQVISTLLACVQDNLFTEVNTGDNLSCSNVDLRSRSICKRCQLYLLRKQIRKIFCLQTRVLLLMVAPSNDKCTAVTFVRLWLFQQMACMFDETSFTQHQAMNYNFIITSLNPHEMIKLCVCGAFHTVLPTLLGRFHFSVRQRRQASRQMHTPTKSMY